MQVSEFKTGASLSSISVAFHGEVIVENWEKKSADYRQFIHVLPWEGVSKRLWEPASASEQRITLSLTRARPRKGRMDW